MTVSLRNNVELSNVDQNGRIQMPSRPQVRSRTIMSHEARSRPCPAHVGILPDSIASGARFFIEDVYPTVDAGRFPVKRIAGEPVDVWADIFRDGHDVIAAALVWRHCEEKAWRVAQMVLRDNDRWQATFVPSAPGRYLYAIEAWTDLFATWRRDYLAKQAAGVASALELAEGRDLLSGINGAPAAPAGRIAAAALRPRPLARDRRHLEWGVLRSCIVPAQDPLLLFRCSA
jgi:hypothetical protein